MSAKTNIKFVKLLPCAQLRPYIKYFAISENEEEQEYKVLPGSGFVIGFQYKGKIANVKNDLVDDLSTAGVTGISDAYKLFKSSANVGSVLVYFTETGFAHFAAHPAHELFNLSISLDDVFDKKSTARVVDQLSSVHTEDQRIKIVEQFLIGQLKEIEADKLVIEAVKLIYQSKGTLRIKDLNEQLFISPSAFEKRFRKVVGTTAKKFASIVRFNAVIADLQDTNSLTQLCYDHHFFDQAHFIKEFKQFTGETPDRFRKDL
ncbi:MAG: helix-turn-helix transcriptional regulator [Saprospiraceae bacterium]|nr:helix-turn-helix transcriptional regulator [Saprospiraceae bacterium]